MTRGRTRHAVALLVLVALVNLPLVHATLTGTHLESDDILIVTLVVDALLLVIALLLWRVGGASGRGCGRSPWATSSGAPRPVRWTA